LRWLRRSCRCGAAFGFNHAHYGIYLDRCAFLDFDLFQHAGGRRWNLGVHFVSGDFKQRLIALDFVARFLQPLGDRAFKDRFAHLGHYNISCHEFLPQVCSRWLDQPMIINQHGEGCGSYRPVSQSYCSLLNGTTESRPCRTSGESSNRSLVFTSFSVTGCEISFPALMRTLGTLGSVASTDSTAAVPTALFSSPVW